MPDADSPAKADNPVAQARTCTELSVGRLVHEAKGAAAFCYICFLITTVNIITDYLLLFLFLLLLLLLLLILLLSLLVY